MMKVIASLFVLFAFSQAAHMTFWYSGSVNATGTPQAPAVDVNAATCTPLATPTGYQNFTVNVTSAGFFYFSALFEKDFRSTAQIQVYQGTFVPTTPCANLYFARGNGGGVVPHIGFVLYLTPGLYPTVVTGSNPLTLGLFAVHVDPTTLNGETVNSNTSTWWSAPTSQSDNTNCDAGITTVPYITFTFNQNGTEEVDILAFAYTVDVSGTWDFSGALYNSSTLNFTGAGNETDPHDPCSTPNFVYTINTDSTDLDFNLQNNYTYQAAAALGITLMNGLSYSVVMGTEESTVLTAKFGAFIRPTALGNLGTTLDFTTPDVPALSTTTECEPDSQKYYGTEWFTAIYNAYILDNPTGFFDTAGCLYQGLNLGDGTNPPINCPGNTSSIRFIQCGDTGDGGPVANFLIPGVNYTWIQFPYSGAGTAGRQYLLYNYSGRLLGQAPVTTTGVATTGPMEESSSASTIIAMFALTIAAMLF